MGNAAGDTFVRRFARLDIIAGVEHALDLAYARLVRTAQRRWQSRFHDSGEAGNAIVKIRLSGKAQTQPGSAFLRPRPQSARGRSQKFIRPRFAD